MYRLVGLMVMVGACSPRVETMAFQGPDGILTVETAQAEVLVAMTHLEVRNAPGPGKRFGEHAEAVANSLYDDPPPGWLGAMFRNEGRLNWWTVTVWESEEAMLEFIVAEPHASAMRALTDVAVSAESRNEWMPVEAAPPPWDDVVVALEDEPRFVYTR